ncbi:MAG: hypothetical protein LLG06_12435 [Desulfobacteraceae bacterium]|nr:hypothetical protein [Desulfobacteraceae bacterium]
MLDKRTLHQKVQEQCDCFATTDPLRAMASLKGEPDPEEGALKWIALAVLHGIGRNAKKISLRRTPDGKVFATAKFRETELPELTPEIGEKVFEAVRNITHLEKEKGKMPVVIGIGDSSVEIDVKLESGGEGESLVLKFPD